MNVPNEISLDEDRRRRAEARAAELGISIADYMRRLAIDLDRQAGAEVSPDDKPDISILFDLVTDGPPTDIARDKDKMIGEAVWQEYLRKTGRRSGAASQSLEA